MMKISEAASQQILQLFSQYAGKSLSMGDTFTGRILSLVDGQLMLALADGSTVNAEVQTGAEYKQGQVLRLEVVGENQGRLIVKETTQQATQTEMKTTDPASVLKALKLPADNSRVEIVKAMLDMEVKPTVSLIEKTSELLKSQQVTDPKQAVFLVLNEMEQTGDYFPLVKGLHDQSFQFQQKWQNLLNSLSGLDDATVVLLADRLLVEDLLQTQDFTALQLPALQQKGSDQPLDNNMISAFKNILQQVLSPELQALPQGTGNLAQIQEFESVTMLLHRFIPETQNMDKSLQDEIVNKLIDLSSQLMAKKAEQPLTPEMARKILTQAGNELPSDRIVGGSDSGLPKVDRWFQDLDGKLESLAGVLSESGKAAELLPEVRELQTAVRFFNDITSYEAFVQLPLLLKDNTTHGELYVMKRKGPRKKLNAEDFSLFLSLSTMNLGTIDTFVHVQNKNVLIRVAVEDDRFYTLLTDEYKPLYEALMVKGFRLFELKVTRREERLNLFNAVKKAREIVEPDLKIDVKV